MKKPDYNSVPHYFSSYYHVLLTRQGNGEDKYSLWVRDGGAKIILKALAIFCILVGAIFYFQHSTVISSSLPFFASIDTMKVSRDTATRPLSEQEIANVVKTSASLNTNYITVDTQWDYPAYMIQWINAIRATGHHVWFRIFPNQWENANNTTGLMTPAQYILSEQKFLQSYPSFFHSGDILDPCPEAEQGLYWKAAYGQNWTSNAPNRATSEYNAFLRQTTDVADASCIRMASRESSLPYGLRMLSLPRIQRFWRKLPYVNSAISLLIAILIRIRKIRMSRQMHGWHN